MKLVYKYTGMEVKCGDVIGISSGEIVEVVSFSKPHKPSSSGKVSVKWKGPVNKSQEFYVSVIGAEWIDREDRPIGNPPTEMDALQAAYEAGIQAERNCAISGDDQPNPYYNPPKVE